MVVALLNLMAAALIQTERLILRQQSEDEARAMVAALPESDRAQISPSWIAELNKVGAVNPWMLGFTITERSSDRVVGQGGFKGPPGVDQAVEVAYVIAEEYRSRGYATEAARALVAHAFLSGEITTVRAHTLPEQNASVRVLTKCGFRYLGEVIEPDDGLVWRWEIARSAAG